MRTLLTLAIALPLVACGNRSGLEISCGGMPCDVSSSNVCCVGQSAAACTSTASCTGAPAFRCAGAKSCPGTEHCCANDLESRCAPACEGQETLACDTTADCPSGMTCNTRTYTSPNGQTLFAISLCQ